MIDDSSIQNILTNSNMFKRLNRNKLKSKHVIACKIPVATYRYLGVAAPLHRYALYIILILFSSCTTFHVTQIDDSKDERKITLDIRGTSWFSSSQTFAKIKALQTDKTQSFGIDDFKQKGATNTVGALKSIEHIIEMLNKP